MPVRMTKVEIAEVLEDFIKILEGEWSGNDEWFARAERAVKQLREEADDGTAN